MSYPTLEQYNEAFQAPQLALCDPELKSGNIATTGLGLPLALCGGFALTYTLKAGSNKYAVRCFHKQSNLLENRYSAISNRIKSLKSTYFLNFEFQPQGVRVSGKVYPVVKMAWASGETLGEFLERNYRSKNDLQSLNTALRSLSGYLENQNVSHGDIQPGNVMVSGGGKSIQLIDYDGMFVEDIKSLGSNELGHRNFQHPGRSNTSWDHKLDRFAFISLALSLRALEAHPELWDKTQSDGDSILFKANDFAEPSRSAIFQDLFGRSQLAEDAKNFAAICKSPFDKIPSLEDFLARKNIPQAVITVSTTASESASKYLSNYPVLDAGSYNVCIRYVGDRVELIGRIVEVKQGRARNGKPYVFINFGPWQKQILKISIWSEGLSALTSQPDQSWIGKWVSVVGLMEPPYSKRGRGYSYTHLAVSITQTNQLHVIAEQVAKYRLAGSSTRSASSNTNNKEILGTIKGTSPTTVKATNQLSKPPITKNQEVLQNMQSSQPRQKPQQQGTASKYKPPYTPTPQPANKNCFIATAVYGAEADETNMLREWRDQKLIPTKLGRCFVETYYLISPSVASIIKNNSLLRTCVRYLLNKFVSKLERR